ncbi:hypothetical protein COOONC_10688 [Cooperia oncophora]
MAGSPFQEVTIGVRRSADSTFSHTFSNLNDCTPGPFAQSVRFINIDQGATRVLPAYCAIPAPAAASSNSQDVLRENTDGNLRCGEQCGDEHSSHRTRCCHQSDDRYTRWISDANYAIGSILNLDSITMTKVQVRTVSSTNKPNDFTDQFTTTMAELAQNEKQIEESLSLDVIHKASEISILSPTILFLFTSTPSEHSTVDSRPISRNMQLTSLLVSSIEATSLVLDDAAEDCSKSTAFSFFIEDVATTAVINVVGLGYFC